MSSAGRVLILDNSIDPALYRPVPHWTRCFEGGFEVFRPPDGGFPHRPTDFSHAIITGSETSIILDDDWIEEECELVRRLAEAAVPLLASCFGHQLVVRALSGRAHVRRSSRPEVGWLEVRVTEEGREDPVLGVLPPRFHAFSSHFDEVTPDPPGWVVLARSDHCPSAALRWAHGPVWGIQHHPEMGPEEGARLLTALPELLPERAAWIRSHTAWEVVDSGVCPALVEAFLAVSGAPEIG